MSHVIMKKSLAKALMDAGMEHYDVGGSISPIGGFGGQLLGMNQYSAATPSYTAQAGILDNIHQQQQRNDDVFGQQQNLANTLLQQSQGQGPNVALNQLNQTTGQNVANQAALMASQRGASANAGLLARQAGQVGAQAQQQAAGQGATLQAQQQLAAQGALAQQQGAMANQALSGESIRQGALASQNQAAIQAQLGAQGINAGISGQNASAMGKLTGGLMGGAAAAFGLAKGGQVPHFAGGGVMGMENYAMPNITMPGFNAPSDSGSNQGANALGNSLGKYLGSGGGSSAAGGLMAGGAADAVTELAPLALMASKGAQVPFSTALVQGGNVPGKAEVKGNSEDNDTVPAMLSPGEVVLPRSVTQAPDVEKKAVEFLEHLKGKKKRGYAAVVEAKCGGGRI